MDREEMGLMLEWAAAERALADVPGARLARAELGSEVERQLATLSPRDAAILRLRFGLDTGEPMAVQAIAAQYGVTDGRIAQCVAAALRRLRHPVRARRLKPHLVA